ncbi:MAG: dockerin type I domain-containing protein [Clostridiales bacterium]|nr:dockerin type I domain-containing protein [Clostridiales bacterium]
MLLNFKNAKIKFLPALICVFICLSAFICTAQAAEALLSVDAPESAQVDDTIDVDIVLSDAESLTGGSVYISFSRKKLQIKSITTGSVIKNCYPAVNLENEEYLSVITFGSIFAADVNGTLATLTFEVIGSGEASIKINTDYTEFSGDFSGMETSYISYSTNDAAIKIYQPGDVNIDGSVDLLDAISVMKYLDGETDLDSVSQSAADMDENGTIDEADVARILKKSISE